MKELKNLLYKTLYVMSPNQKRLSVLVFFLTCIGSIMECLGVSVIIPLVSVIQSPDAIMQSQFFRKHEVLQQLTYSQLVALIVCGVIALYVVKNLFFIFLSWVRIKFSTKIQREMAIKMMTSLMSRGYQYYLNNNFSEYQRSIGNDAAAINGVVSAGFKLISECLTILLISIFMFVSDWQLALSVVCLALICLALIYFIFRKVMFRAGQNARIYGAKMGQTLLESFFGIKDILLFRKQQYFISEYETNSIKTQKAQCTQTVGSESPAYIIEAICISGLMICVCMKVVFYGSSPEFVAILAAFAVGAFRVLPSLGKISSSLNLITGSMPQINALYDEIRVAEEFAKEHPYAIDFIDLNENKGLISKGAIYRFGEKKTVYSEGKFRDKLELQNIKFAYDGEYGNVLNGVNLTIKKGQSIGIIGESGAGKSTLVDVLLGLLLPQEGQILMDGVNIKEISDKWAETIAYVPQTVFLSDASVRKNVAFGERDQDIDDTLVKDALQQAEMLAFVETLPDGLENETGDRGVRLSGGQRQRIAIARALYHRPEIFVLDEATSALDNETEAAIMDAINLLQGQITLVIVAHRLTTVQNCDVIYEVKDGGIIVRDKNEIFGDN